MNYWLFKTEPDTFGIDHLAAQTVSCWDGVRNYQARNFLRQCAVGDLVFIYHSSCKRIGIAGIGKIVRAAYADPSQFDKKHSAFDAASVADNPRWTAVDVGFVEKFADVLELSALKKHPALQDMALLKKGSRLSVMPVTTVEYKTILMLAKTFKKTALS